MTTNADRKTPYEYETTNALIAEVRRLRADDIAPQSSRNRLVALTEQLADALEAAQAQVARQEALLSEILQCGVLSSSWKYMEAVGVVLDRYYTEGKNPSWPADLLAAVRFLVRFGYLNDQVRATLQRYGLIEKEATDVVAR